MNEKIRIYYYGTSSQIVFVRFLGELKTPKRHFEINWPLVTEKENLAWFKFLVSPDLDIFFFTPNMVKLELIDKTSFQVPN